MLDLLLSPFLERVTVLMGEKESCRPKLLVVVVLVLVVGGVFLDLLLAAPTQTSDGTWGTAPWMILV